MKGTTLSAIVTLILSSLWITGNGQESIKIKVNHMLGESAFALNMKARNDLDYPFTVNRLEYYLSEFTVIHDGKETKIPDLIVLANAANELEIDLGAIDATKIEGLKFFVGVHPDLNHLDPAQYPEGHPLALKDPSMHWGWAGGYRYVALEGKGGEDATFIYEIHALGVVNYKEVNIPVDIIHDGNTTIVLDAHYDQLLSNIKVENGLFSHGEKFEAKALILNFVNKVFELADSPTSTKDYIDDMISIYPNPSSNMQVNIDAPQDGTTSIAAYDTKGVMVLDKEGMGNMQLSFAQTGLYWLKITLPSGAQLYKQLVILE